MNLPGKRIGDTAGWVYKKSDWEKSIRYLKWLLGIALLIISLQGVNYEFIKQQVSEVDLFWLFLTLLSMLVSLLLKTLRWNIFLRNYQLNFSLIRVAQAFFVGQAANILMPIRSGELVRLSWLMNKSPGSAPQITATILFEKYLDTLALTFCITQVLIYLPIEQTDRAKQILVPISLTATLLLVLVVLLGPGAWLWFRKRTMPIQAGRLEKFFRKFDALIENSLWLRKPDRIAVSVGITALIWGSMLLTNLLLFKSLRIPLGFEAGGLVLVLVYLGLFPAIMPGNVGPFYFFAQLALKPFQVHGSQALAFAILLHLITTLPSLIVGSLLLLRSDAPPNIAFKRIVNHWKQL